MPIDTSQLLKTTSLFLVIFTACFYTNSKQILIYKSMASSSSSSHSVPASISQSWNYDVFLSFRGEDTRKSFVDHLYAALEQQGIHTYKDDGTLPRGESIGPALLKAIQDSRVAVVVFSKNYADSSWCLDELAHIMECMDTKGQIVMPIFYHVDPSDVRKLKRKYGEAFDKHSVGDHNLKVESWRKALERAGKLSGWVINDIENSLPNLKILHLSDLKNLITTPDFDGLPCLERLILSWCKSLEEIHPSIGYHKRLVFVNLNCCERLKSFPPIIHMKKLETLNLLVCEQLQQFPDIQSNMDSLVTLHLDSTNIEIIPPSVGRLPGLKLLDLSNCWNLVELPDLPSSIAILKAQHCQSLEIIGDLSYYKWLWKVSLWGCDKLIGGERVLHSMLEGNAAKDRFMSVSLSVVEPSSRIFTRLVTLQLPSNWYSDFSGLLLFLRDNNDGEVGHDIDIKQETSTFDCSEESDEDEDWKQWEYEVVGYVPFNSLRHIPWLNPTYTKNISFHSCYGVGLNVELVRSKNKTVDLNENPIDYSECWDEDRKTFEIMYDSQSSNIRIVWKHE
ncbi:putative TIR domain, leucine-rich repeat domain superfamily [Helianthus debilis subsp. tardiflorus]